MIIRFAQRYFWGRKSTQAIHIISWVSVLAIAVGTSALIVVLSVFNGFEDLVKSLYSSFYPAIRVEPARGPKFIVQAAQLQHIRNLPSVKAVSQTIETKASISYNNRQMVAIVKGVDTAWVRVTGLKDKIVRGEYALGSAEIPGAVIGIGIESALGVDLQNPIYPLMVYVPNPQVQTFLNPEQALRVGSLIPQGVFAIQEEFDDRYVITRIDEVRQLLLWPPGAVSALEIAVYPGAQLSDIQRRVSQILGSDVVVKTRYQQNETLYQVMQTEKWVVYALLSFILVIAAFNMIGALSMLVIDKQHDIAILRAMGATNGLIQRIFLAEGLWIAFTGTLLGVCIALVLCLGQQRYGWIKLGGHSFVIDAYPVSLKAEDFLLVIITVVIIAALASYLPAHRAGRQELDLKSLRA
ncbi:MAG: FtsX-like permease family protein [Thermoflavifilum sp.]|nr:FtsX-like permease family protein [Thermoflavifilum sp.]